MMRPEDIGRLAIPSDPRFHADGRRVAFVVSRIDLEGDRYLRQVWVAGESGPAPFTAGPGDTSPRWSPDGSRLAFLRKPEDGHAQVVVMPADGGEGRAVTDLDLGVEAVEWSPDGSRLVVVGVTWEEGWEGLDEEERARRPRRISAVPYRFDTRGTLFDRRRHLWLVDPAGEAPARCLTPGRFDETAPSWSPDGTRVAFLSDRHPRQGLEPGTDPWELEVDGGRVRRLADRGLWSAVTYRPDGVAHLVGHPDTNTPQVTRVHRVEDDGALTDLTGHLDRSVTSFLVPAPVHWVGKVAYCPHEDSGTMGVVTVHPDGRVDVVVEGPRVVTGFMPSPDGERLACTVSTGSGPGELVMVSGAKEEAVTDLNHGVEVLESDHFRVVGEGVQIDAWVVAPAGDEPVPVLVNIHGGPATQYGFGFFDEFQVYAGAGFAVMACNPRGSSGRGDEFMRAVTGDGWGVVDMADVEAALDAALARFPRLDPDRVGIMGGSYGGFLTAWIIARRHRYRSAVVERALLSWPSFVGTSDIGPTFPADYTGADFPDGWEVWWEKSPLATAHQIRTPTLIVHSEEDWRCPIEQAEQLFVSLLEAGTETEMLRFPGEGHELSRSGAPRHRVERLEAIIDWHRRWLGGSPGEGSAQPGSPEEEDG